MNNIISFWNSQSGKYQYTVGKGKDAVSYLVNFNLSEATNVTYNEGGGVSTEGEQAPTNSIEVMSNKDFTKVQERMGSSEVEGVNWYSQILVPKSRVNDKNVANHEGGHNLGMTHKSQDVMSASLEDVNTRTNPSNISEVLGRAGYGPNATNINAGAAWGKAYAHKISGTAPENFASGTVNRTPKTKTKKR